MPGEHIDKLVKEYTDRMTYEGLKGEARAKATPEEIELDKTKYGVEVGSQIFKEIEGSSLSPEERQEVYQKLVKAGVQNELDNTEDPATLLRGNNATTRFMSDYMNTYAKEYVDAMYEDTLEAALKAKSQLPDSLVGKKVDSPYGHIPDVSEEDKTKLYKAYGEVAKSSIESSERNLSKLSPEAREFMKAALEPVGTNKQAMNTATASTLLLRCASPMISNTGGLLRDNVETQDVGNLLMGANIALQTYANSMNRSHDNPLPPTKPQNVVSNELRTKDGMEQTSSAYQSIADGSIDTFVSKLAPKVDDVGVDLSKEMENTKRVTEILKRGELKPFEDRIKQLEATQKQLKENPTIGDHIKCFFKHGLKGVQGEIEKIEGKIQVTSIARQGVFEGKSVDELQKKLEGMKVDRAEFALAMQMTRMEVGRRAMEDSQNMTPTISDKQDQQARDTHSRAKVEKESLDKGIKQQEKVLSVREKLGPKAPQQSQGEKQGKSLSV